MQCIEQTEQRAQYLRTLFDTIPLPAFILDEDVRIQDFNMAAAQFIGPEPASALYRRGGEALHCIHSQAAGCGKARPCEDCLIRRSVLRAIQGETTWRERHTVELNNGRGPSPTELLVTASLLPYTEKPQALLILENLTETMTAYGPARAAGLRAARRV